MPALINKDPELEAFKNMSGSAVNKETSGRTSSLLLGAVQ